ITAPLLSLFFAFGRILEDGWKRLTPNRVAGLPTQSVASNLDGCACERVIIKGFPQNPETKRMLGEWRVSFPKSGDAEHSLHRLIVSGVFGIGQGTEGSVRLRRIYVRQVQNHSLKILGVIRQDLPVAELIGKLLYGR